MTLRSIERESIRAFVEQAGADGYLTGRVLDYGCGKQPYRALVQSYGAEYLPFDRMTFPASCAERDWGGDDESVGPIDTILCTQVLQYIEHPDALLSRMPRLFQFLGGHLVLTYPTHWPEVEPKDLHRFTKAGMERLLTEAGFEIVKHEMRYWIRGATGPWETDILPDKFALGYGVIARA